MTMLAIEFRFPTGRYHATPWGRHVNEADVEWPPAPWRILRALIATWHRKADHDRFPASLLEGTILSLSASLPAYHLPGAIRSHTRHYMPVREGKKDKPVLIFDGFARFKADTPLVAVWPEVTLPPENLALMEHLAENIAYLGRAESWVEARVLQEWNGELNCRPSELSVDPETGEAFEPIRLPAPMPDEEYQTLRQQTISSHDLDAKRLKKKQKQILQTLPERLIDAMRLDTSDIQGAGWSCPPGARFITYQRPYDCFMTASQPRRSRRKQSPDAVTTARLALMDKPLPRVEDSVRIGELVRKALIARSSKGGDERVPQVISGHDMPKENRHGHAFYLPEDSDDDGHIDHLIIHAEAGLAGEALQLIDRLDRLWERNRGEWQVMLEQYGTARQISGSRHVGESRVWYSTTPYLHPWHLKKRLDIEDQILRECRIRGLPQPEVEPLPEVTIHGKQRRPVHFHRFRNKRGLTQPDTRGSFWRLTFSEPMMGPLALGFGCHFGLGLFARRDED